MVERSRRPLPPLWMAGITLFSLVVAFAVAWAVVVRPAQGAPEKISAQQLVDGRAGSEAKVDGSAAVGSPMPTASVERLDASGVLDLDEVREGRPMLVNFWASTCAPCLKEMPALEATHQQRPDVAVVGIDVADSVDAGRKMIERTGVTFPQGRDPRSTVIAAFGGAVLPHTVAVDAEGEVVAIHSGALDESSIAELLEKATAGAGAGG